MCDELSHTGQGNSSLLLKTFLVISPGLAYCPTLPLLSSQWCVSCSCSPLQMLVFLISFLSIFPSSILLEPPLKVSHLLVVPNSLSDTHFQLSPRQTPLDSIQELSIRHLHYSTHYSPPTDLCLTWILSFCHQKLWSRLWLLVPQPPCPVCHLWPTAAEKCVWNSLLYTHYPRLLLALPWVVEKAPLWPLGLKNYRSKPFLSSQNIALTTSQPSGKPSGPPSLPNNGVKRSRTWVVSQNCISLHCLVSSCFFFFFSGQNITCYGVRGWPWLQPCLQGCKTEMRSFI